MNVGELKLLLEQYSNHTEVVTESHSDYAVVSSLKLIRGIPQYGYVMRTHPTMSAEKTATEKVYLLLDLL